MKFYKTIYAEKYDVVDGKLKIFFKNISEVIEIEIKNDSSKKSFKLEDDKWEWRDNTLSLQIEDIDVPRGQYFIEIVDNSEFNKRIRFENFREKYIFERFWTRKQIDKFDLVTSGYYINIDGYFAINVSHNLRLSTFVSRYPYFANVFTVNKKKNSIFVEGKIKFSKDILDQISLDSLEPVLYLSLSQDQKIIQSKNFDVQKSENDDLYFFNAIFDIEDLDIDYSYYFAIVQKYAASNYRYLHVYSADQKIFNRINNKSLPPIIYKNSQQYISLQLNAGNFLTLMTSKKSELAKTTVRMKAATAFLTKKILNGFKVPRRKMIGFEREGFYAQDNAFALFEISNSSQFRFILNKKSPRYKEIKNKYGVKIIPMFSFRHFLSLGRAKKFYTSIYPKEILTKRTQSSGLIQSISSTPIYYLGHGLLAFKKMGSDYNANTGLFDRVISGSKFETKALKELGFKSKQIFEAGYPRWDLYPQVVKNSKNIVYMPTWRDWIDEKNDESFIQSELFNKISALIEDQSLNTFLEKNNFKFIIYLHPNMRSLSNKFERNLPKNFMVEISGNEDFGLMLSTTTLLISDYSSVVWDFAIKKIPVVLYQFDQRKYIDERDGYINIKTEKIAPIVKKHDKLVQFIIDKGNYKHQTKLAESFIKKNIFNQEPSEKVLEDFINWKGKKATKKIAKRSYRAMLGYWKRANGSIDLDLE